MPDSRQVLDIAIDLARVYRRCPEVAAVVAQSWHWRCPRQRGAGVALGLIEPGIHRNVPDLFGAALVLRPFTSNPEPAEALMAHGTHSASLLVGQGHKSVLGLVPQAQLFVALVAQADGTANPAVLAAAIDWLTSQSVALLAIPMGDRVDHTVISQAILRARKRNVQVYAAAGNSHPEPIAFPARHRAALAIGAIDSSCDLRAECCRKPELDILAPGTDIPAWVDDWHVEPRSGTSVACVVAAGLAALSLWATNAHQNPYAHPALPRRSQRRPVFCPTAQKEISND